MKSEQEKNLTRNSFRVRGCCLSEQYDLSESLGKR